MNAKQRREYWKKIERLRGQLDAKYFEQVRNSIIAQFKRFARDIEAIGVDAARSRLGLDLWDKEMLKIFEAMYKESVILFGNSVYRALKIEANQKAETFGFNREWTDSVLEFLLKQGFVLVADITSTTKKKLLDIVSKGIEEGMGVDEIVKIITSDEQLAYATFRARRIVRTEVMRSSNIGAMKGAEAHPFEVDKQWISARDARTRRIPQDEFDHVELDNVIVPFNEAFTSTGKKGEPVSAMQPGDITAPAGFTINCFLPNEKTNINLKHIKRAFRNIYIGNVVTIQSANGNSFTCTPNHPIMTDKGWVAAGLLKQGDKLIKSSVINDSFIPEFNINGNQSSFKQIYDSLSYVNKPIRVRKTIVNFYGDIPNSDVNVVNVKSKLRNTIKTSFSNFCNKILFKYSNFRQSLRFSFSRFFESLNNFIFACSSHCLVGFRNQQLFIFNRSLAHTQIHRFTSIPLRNTSFLKSYKNNVSTNTKFFSNTLDTNTGIIHTDNSFNRDSMVVMVTGTNTFHYEGFVYTFETDNQMYDINSFVARNCRCTVGFIPKRNANGRLIMKPRLNEPQIR